MSDDVLTLDRQTLRGTDSNSLLRLYDRASAVFNRSLFQQERARADKTIQRIAEELKRRKVPFTAGHEQAPSSRGGANIPPQPQPESRPSWQAES